MKKYPLVSFCISTYKRSDFLKSTIEVILAQKYENLEIIICEDPSDKTSEKMIKSFKSKKIIYHKNKKHLGMVKSFNKAFSLSTGDFITILADDDPPVKDMLEVFMSTLNKYPDMKAMFGASYANITSKEIEQPPYLKKGFNSLINKQMPYGTTKILDSKKFFKQFFKQELFPHYLWNSSLISRNLVSKIHGVPDYNSAHFSDYAYLLKISEQTKFIIVNKELATFSLHKQNYGKKKDTLDEYKRGVIGFDKTVSSIAYKFGLKSEYQKFLSDYIIMFLIDRFLFYKKLKYKISSRELFNVYIDLSNNLEFLKMRRTEVFLKLNFHYLFKLISLLRRRYGQVITTLNSDLKLMLYKV